MHRAASPSPSSYPHPYPCLQPRFRDTPFFVSAAKAERLLDFSPSFDLKDDIAMYYNDNYKAQGGLDKEVSFADDVVVLGK
jgi:nucleoside-diphosphate-sugar epimerase